MHKKGIMLCSAAFAAILIVGCIFLALYHPMTATEKNEKLYAGALTYEMKFEGIDDVVTFETYPNLAPKTVKNFDKLVKKSYYDGLDVHRIIDNLIIQTGRGDKASAIKGEFSDNGFDNPLSHTRGVISMARANDYDSASSQFFIVLSDTLTTLDGQYAAFGKVTQGIEVIDAVADAECEGETPINAPVIEYIKQVK